MPVLVLGERYEVVRARIDLIEAACEFDAARTRAEREMALERADDARCRILRWQHEEDD